MRQIGKFMKLRQRNEIFKKYFMKTNCLPDSQYKIILFFITDQFSHKVIREIRQISIV